MMHAGSLTGNTAAARVYRVLKAESPSSVGGWDLSLMARVTAVSTRVSEVRHELERLNLPERVEVTRIGREYFYRIVGAEQCV